MLKKKLQQFLNFNATLYFPMQYADGISTERLITRPLVYEDHIAWAGFFADEKATRFLTTLGEPDYTKRAIAWINKQLTRYAAGEYGLQALIHKSTGEVVGQCGLLTQEVDGVTELEIGYHIFPKFWGMGYATEAAKKYKEYTFNNNLAPSVISIIHRHNLASQRVALKNGMLKEKATIFYDIDVYVYRSENRKM